MSPIELFWTAKKLWGLNYGAMLPPSIMDLLVIVVLTPYLVEVVVLEEDVLHRGFVICQPCSLGAIYM